MSQPPNTKSFRSLSGTNFLISGDRPSVRFPSRIVLNCVSEPSGCNCSSLAEVVARSVDMSEVRIISHILQSAPALTALGQRSRSVCPPQQLHPVLICPHGSGSLDSLYVVLRT